MEVKNNKFLKFTLSVAMPTYNQPEHFRRALESIVFQITSEVEIVIRDDSTNDETKKIVQEYEKNYSNIKYFRGEKLGIDGVDFFITENSAGEYVWWFGDDEMMPGAISRALSLIRQYPEIDFMWINSKCREGDVISINLGESRFFKDGNEAVTELADQIGYLSAIFFKREKFLPHITAARKYMGSCLAMIYPLFAILSGNGKFYFLAEPYFIGDPKDMNKQLFFNSFQVWGVNYYKILKEFKNKFSNKAIKKALSKNFKQVYRGIIVARAKGYTVNFGSSFSIYVMFKLYWSFIDFWLALPFLLMPRFILKWFYKIYKIIFPKTLGRLGK